MEEAAYQRLQVIQILPETKDASTFVLHPIGWQPLYKPGQFLTLVFTTPHGEKRRSYSISSSPFLNEHLSITVKRVENGEFSRFLLANVKEGDVLHTAGISGLFLLPDDLNSAKQYFFLAAGSGITPCYALIKTLLVNTQADIILVYSNRSEEDTIFKTSLEQWAASYKQRLKIEFLFSNRPHVLKSRLSNWLLQQLLKKYLFQDKDGVLFYLCGPFEFMQMATITLLNEQIKSANIRKENYNSLPRLVKPSPPDTAKHMVTIHINNKTYAIKVQYPHTILAVAKETKIPIPFSCEAGRCGSCAATCIHGSVWMAYNEVLLEDEINSGRILCCQAYPIGGDVEIRL